MHILSHLGIWKAEDGHVGHARMHDEAGLDFGGVDVHASRDDGERCPVCQVEVAVIIQISDITEGRPVLVLGMAAPLRFLWILVVFERGEFLLEVDQARRARRNLPAEVIADVRDAENRTTN